MPICRPTIEDGYIGIDKEGTIVYLGQEAPPTFQDLGNVALLPGWVNAHTHLELSGFERPLGQPGTHLAKWIVDVVAARQQRELPIEQAFQRGVEQSLSYGVRLIGDIAQQSSLSILNATAELGNPLEIISFREVLGLNQERAESMLSGAVKLLNEPAEPCIQLGISPHAPYSTRPETVAACVAASVRYRVPVAMHLAEAAEEEELTRFGTGPFADALRVMGVWRDGLFPNGSSQLDWLRLLANAERALIIHGNYLTPNSIDFLSRQPQMSVVYCPRTHAYFGHPLHPVADLLAAGVRVCLGTDSLASNPDLDIAAEVKWLLQHRSDLHREQVLRMATLSGADALGRPDCGRIELGCRPGFRIVPLCDDR